MSPRLRNLIALIAILAPALHTLTDVMEVAGNGFSRSQLIINYLAFLLMPFMMIGLYSVQIPQIKWPGLVGAFVYAVSFIYFAHTTLVALEESVANYEILWHRLGAVYTIHGALMVIGGIIFGIASLRANVLWRTGSILFIVGLLLNLILDLVPVSAILQTAGSTIRNAGLIGIGIKMFLDDSPRRTDTTLKA